MANSDNVLTPTLADKIREKTSCITALNHGITNLLDEIEDEVGEKKTKVDILYLLIVSDQISNDIDELLRKNKV